jgi:hypothetical protein
MGVVRHELPLSLGPIRAGDLVHVTKRRPDLVGKDQRATYHHVGYVTKVKPYLNDAYRIEMHLSGLRASVRRFHFGWDEVNYRNTTIEVLGHIPLPPERDPSRCRSGALCYPSYRPWWASWTQSREYSDRFREEVSEFLGRDVLDRLAALWEICWRDLGGQDAW